jgi:outer membrane protein OmpA-like peptidoglycan-associated protein
LAFGGSFFSAASSASYVLRRAVWTAVFLLCLCRPAEPDVRGSRDHPLFKRPAGYQIVSYFQGDRAAVLPLENGSVSLAGRQTEILYRTKGTPLSASALVYRFLTSLQGAGGEVLFRENPALGGRRAVGKFVRPGRDVWVTQEVLSLREYRLTVLEESGRRPSLPPSPVPAKSLDTEAQVLDLLYSLERTGRLEFPVKFPSRSSVPQKGYEKNFEKFALLMEKDPSMNFRVETYTDSGLKPAEERALLRERAAALVDLLAGRGADRKRLTTEAVSGSEPLSESSQNAPPRGVVRLTLVESAESGPNR